jgi:hypothetical protein
MESVKLKRSAVASRAAMFPRQEPDRGLRSGVGWQIGTLQVDAVRTLVASVIVPAPAVTADEEKGLGFEVRARGLGRSNVGGDVGNG